MTARASIGLVLVLTMMSASCGSRGAAVREAPASTTAAAHDEPRGGDLDEASEPAAAPPSFTDAQLDAMERSEIEAACVAGSTMACDRLGH